MERVPQMQAEFSSLDLKGVVRPNLERLVEEYRTRATQLKQDLASLQEALGARKESNLEKVEENAVVEAEVRHGLEQVCAKIQSRRTNQATN
jgi:hypothetical protein